MKARRMRDITPTVVSSRGIAENGEKIEMRTRGTEKARAREGKRARRQRERERKRATAADETEIDQSERKSEAEGDRWSKEGNLGREDGKAGIVAPRLA